MKTIFTSLIFLSGLSLYSQDSLGTKKEPIKMDILYGYYQQNGSNSAVTGGTGTEQLDNHAPLYIVNIPLKDTSSLNVNFGVDHYSCASTLNINRYVSSASTGTSTVSGQDTRFHGDAAYTFRENRLDHKLKFGFSTEYDVLSFNAAYGVQVPLKKYDQQISLNINTFWDRWLLIYPGELDPYTLENSGDHGGSGGESDSGSGAGYGDTGSGGDAGSGDDSSGGDAGSGDDGSSDDGSGDDGSGSSGGNIGNLGNDFITPLSGSDGSSYGTTGDINAEGKDRYGKDWRKTFNLSIRHSATINKKMKVATTLNVIFQNGLLNTPFHRVYFNDGIVDEVNKLVRVENLPRQRLKLALTFQHNYFMTRFLVLKTMVRVYGDSWKSKAITSEVQVALKMNKIITFYPFYRFHFQTAIDYFAPYGGQFTYSYFYTSDFDLSQFTAHKYGLGMRLNPVYGINLIKGKKSNLQLDSFDLRLGSYVRSNGLKAQMVSFGMHFVMNPNH